LLALVQFPIVCGVVIFC